MKQSSHAALLPEFRAHLNANQQLKNKCWGNSDVKVADKLFVMPHRG
ncbi:MAG: hypothetical protein NTZ94_17275 [Verrucomicrobia bacterium]|nr:hypothetical protein [Verrucomicrobiota bacterium]